MSKQNIADAIEADVCNALIVYATFCKTSTCISLRMVCIYRSSIFTVRATLHNVFLYIHAAAGARWGYVRVVEVQ
jgi:hypothetical protein